MGFEIYIDRIALGTGPILHGAPPEISGDYICSPMHPASSHAEPPGRLHLICGGKDFEEIVLVPTGLELLGMNAAFGRFFLFE
jgi:hypothetical protein